MFSVVDIALLWNYRFLLGVLSGLYGFARWLLGHSGLLLGISGVLWD